MLLKSLEIFGFKSFQKRTKIEFADGITALLGPNGCGKSNVVEAIKWVLGEQSAKSLRAKSMSEIIFKGTQEEPPMNMAEVRLTFQDDDNVMNLGVADVSIKRRVYRAGENEYFINETPVLLKDIRELFFDTGMGKSAYSIIEQGQIDRILSTKPEDRRFIFDEVAGINKFKARQQEAERKLEQTAANLEQAALIMKDVSRSHDLLKSQAEKAVLARELKTQIFDIEIKLQLLKLRRHLETKNTKETAYNERVLEKVKLQDSIEEMSKALQAGKGELDSMENKMQQTLTLLNSLKYEKQSLESAIGFLEEKENGILDTIASLEEALSHVEDKIKEIDKRILDKQEIIESYDLKLGELEEEKAKLSGEIEYAREKTVLNSDEIRTLQVRIRENETLQRQLNADMAALTDDIVRKLDEGFKETDFNFEAKHRLEEEIEAVLTEMKAIIGAKSGVAKLLKAPESPLSSDETESMADSLYTGWVETARLWDALSQAFEKYRNVLPRFLEDFLSPEGLVAEKKKIHDKIDRLIADIESGRERIAELTDENHFLESRIAEDRAREGQLNIKKVQLETQRQGFEDQIALHETEKAEQYKSVEKNQALIRTENEKLHEVRNQIKEKRQDIDMIEKQREKLNAEYHNLEKNISKNSESLIKAAEKISKTQDRLRDMEENLSSLNASLIAVKADIKNIYENFTDKHGRSLSEFDSMVYEISDKEPQLKSDYEAKTKTLSGLGSINYMAPEEYKEVKERYDFLSSQIKDLETAKKDLEKVTEKIKAEATEMFEEAFKKVRKNFHSMFRRLFGGGNAEIRLLDTADVLNSGIEILAEPPGLKLQSIGLLSGGQRSMTSVALIFAIFMVKPSPFCLLDEIDAALDESNIGHFISTLQEFSHQSQFIIITHNKKTAAAASSIIGVTMPKAGISAVFSTQLDNESRVYREKRLAQIEEAESHDSIEED